MSSKTKDEIIWEKDVIKQRRRVHFGYILVILIPIIWLILYQQTVIYLSDIMGLDERTVSLIEVAKAEYRPTTIIEKIDMRAVEAGIDPEEALAVGRCESQLDPKAKSKTSTAKGIFQFINSTWARKCQGDVLNEDDNIACFVAYYPKHKGEWECAKLLGYIK